ncbi:MAG: endonuclease domain-containing protein [Rhabdochlamydiaceae bacterium]
MKQLARNLRHVQTDAEAQLWRHLRNRQLGGFKFRRQYWIGNYIVDFVCVEHSLIVEIDGGQHAHEVIASQDQARTAFLEKQGFRVLRFWNNEVLGNTQSVLESILSVLQNITPHPPLSPQRGEGGKMTTPHSILSPERERGQGNDLQD